MDDGSRESERITNVAGGTIAPTEPVTGGGGPSAPRAASGSKELLPVMGYELGVAIGRGGMGEVIAAFDRRIGREVAIKRMRSPHPSEEATARFLREARIQAWLDHPAVVPVHELGTDDAGRPYFTMKRISGRTLDQLIREGATQQPAPARVRRRRASPSSSRTRAAWSTATSSRRTSCSATTARSTCSTGASRACSPGRR